MSKSFKIFAFYALLLTLAQSLKSLENEKIPFNPSETQSKSNNSKNGLEILPIKVIFNSSEYVIVGRNGTFIFSS
jgi:YbbR domain-containing protein